MKSRFDLYGPVHRGLRHALQSTSLRLGQLDPEDAADAQEALAQLRDTLNWLDEHLHIEERFVHAAIEQRQPHALPASMREDHDHHQRALAVLRADTDAFEHAAGEGVQARRERTRRLYLAFSRFVGENLTHMAFEEEEMNPLLWRLFSDAELAEVYGGIVAAESAEQLGRAVRWMIPALAPQERAATVASARSAIEPAVFDHLLATIRSLISARDWTKLASAIGAEEGA